MKINALNLVLPEVAVVRESRLSRGRLLLIVAGAALFVALLAFALFSLLAKQEETARQSATKFAVALVHNDPSAAPAGAADYVDGVRSYFGPVKSAEVIGAHNRAVNTGDSADTRTYFVVEMLIHTKRGPGALELEFDNHSLSSEEVTRVKELEPGDAPGLSPAERRQLGAAFSARGGEPATTERLLAPVVARPQSRPQPTRVAAPSTPPVTLESRKADKQLRCVQRAHGDVAKLQKCA